MRQELEHSPCTMSLIASLNASAILCAFLWTCLLPKEPTENFGVKYWLLISTETSQSSMKTRLRITLPLRWDLYGTFSFLTLTMTNTYKAKISYSNKFLSLITYMVFFFSVVLFFLTVSKRRYLSTKLQKSHVWMSLPKQFHRRILRERYTLP